LFDSDSLFRGDFLEEISFMKEIGYNRHILALLGCVSDSRNPVIITEFCAHGDLIHMLHRTKNKLRKVGHITDTESMIQNKFI
jgi:hypothetical protein